MTHTERKAIIARKMQREVETARAVLEDIERWIADDCDGCFGDMDENHTGIAQILRNAAEIHVAIKTIARLATE